MPHILDFLHMGGYAKYIWLSYGSVFALLLLHYILPLRKHRNLLRQLKANAQNNPATHAGTKTTTPKTSA